MTAPRRRTCSRTSADERLRLRSNTMAVDDFPGIHVRQGLTASGRMLSPALLLVIGALVLGACTGSPTDAPNGPPTDQTDGTNADTDDGSGSERAIDPELLAAIDAAPIPDSPAGDQLRFILRSLQPNGVPSAATAEEHFHATFLAEVPPQQIVGLFSQLATDGPWRPGQAVAGEGDQLSIVVHGEADPGEMRIDLAVGDEGTIAGLFFRPVPEVPNLDDLEEVPGALDDLADETSTMVARIEDDGCVPVVADDADAPRAIASTAKLYVLHAVATAVEAGEIAWDDEVTLTDADRSLPSGVLQDEPAGTTRTVRQLAAGMIEISDNTATDHLITLVGRDAVEAAVVDAGHADPSLLAPYLRTREAFAIGWDDDRRDAWAEADTAARRELLAGLPEGTGGVTVNQLVSATEPVWPHDVDWFASMSDVCEVHAALDLDDPTVAQTVGTNPGLELDASLTRPAFKGGSVHGVLALSWSVDAPDGDRWFIGVALNDPEEPVDELAAFGITERLLELFVDRVG